MSYLPGMAVGVGQFMEPPLLGYEVVNSLFTQGSRVPWPTGIKKGDLLLGYAIMDEDRNFTSNGGFIRVAQSFNTSGFANGTGLTCVKVAHGLEAGTIGGLTYEAYPYVEAIEVLRFNRPVKKVTVIHGSSHVRNDVPSSQQIPVAAKGAPAKYALSTSGGAYRYNYTPGFPFAYDHGGDYGTTSIIKTRGRLFSEYEQPLGGWCTMVSLGRDTFLQTGLLELE